MVGITVNVTGVEVKTELVGHLTAGMVGVPVRFELDDAWEGLLITAVFRAGDVVRDVELDGMDITVPWEVLSRAYQGLEIGIEGRNEDGSVVIPTLWGVVGEISPGANVSANPALDPTLTRYDSIVRKIQALDDSIPAWSREPEKPKYSAAEVNALSADTLQESVMLALDEAKQSGRFDGPKGDTGVTPAFTIGEVETLDAGTNATASITGTAEKPVLNLGIPKGEKGEGGSGGGGLGGADWNAAEGEPGHVLNRTHWVDVTRGFSYVLDDSGAQPSVAFSVGNIVKVSDETPALEEMTAEDVVCQVTYMGDVMSGPIWQFGVSPTQLSDTAYSFMMDGMPLITVCTEIFELQAGVVLEPGVHFLWADGTVGVMSVTRQGKEEIHQLEAKYVEGMYGEEIVDILPETTLSGSGGQFSLDAELQFVIGETYVVTYNGTKYTCVCYSISEGGASVVGLGNGVLFGAEDTGEPFCIGNASMIPGATMVVDISAADTCTISVSRNVITKVSSEYLDLDWIPKIGQEQFEGVVQPTFEMEFRGAVGGGMHDTSNATGAKIKAGDRILVQFDDKVYDLIAKEETGTLNMGSVGTFPLYMIYVGNANWQDGEVGTYGFTPGTEPFCIGFTERNPIENVIETGVFITKTSESLVGTHKITIWAERNITKMPEELLPESVDGVVIRSSTEGSTKKFKLTVDDSGTITATQVNE